MNGFRFGALFRSGAALLFVVGSMLFAGCGGGSGQQSDSSAQPADTAQMAKADTAAAGQSSDGKAERVEEKEPVEGLGIFQGAIVRESPGGEFVTRLNVGEPFTFLNEIQEAERGGETHEYSKVRLKGGNEGWVRSDMIATDAKPAAVLEETVLHERPTPMASTDQSFKAMDVVAVMDTQDAFVKVKGTRRGENWWDEGWVQPDVLTQNEMDVAVAGLWKKAREEQDSTKRQEALKRITDNPSFEESVFVDSVKARMDKSGSS